MIRHHYFQCKADADRCLRNLRARGVLGYLLGRTSDSFEVREITA